MDSSSTSNPYIFLDKICSLTSTLEDVREGIELKNSLLPKSIYKFRSLDHRSVQNLLDQKLWFGNPKEMNDPYECRFTINPLLDKTLADENIYKFLFNNDETKYDLSLLNQIQNNQINLRQLLNHLNSIGIPLNKVIEEFDKSDNTTLDRLISKYLESTYFCSLSERNDSILMWSHYTNNHNGFCLEFNVASLHKNDPFRIYLYPVDYTNKMFNISSFMEDSIDKLNPLFLVLPTVNKSDDWSYEKEWRVIFTHGQFTNSRLVQTPRPSSILLGVNFFKQFDITEEKRDEEFETKRSLATQIINYAKDNRIELKIMNLSYKCYSLESSIINHEQALKLLSL